MRPADCKTPEELDGWMVRQQAKQAESSTTEYYNNNKDTSFPVNLDSDIRGRAIVFVMTAGRTLWQNEVWAQYKMYNAIRYHVEFIYDPRISEIRQRIKNFVRNNRSKEADMVFIAFCGHGYSTVENKNGVYLETDDYDFDILAECQLAFSTRNCEIKEKPKVFLVQACRSIVKVRNRVNIITCITKPRGLKKCMIVFASEPGEPAWRCIFMESASELVINNSCKCDLQDILGQKLNAQMKSTQKPSFSSDMKLSLNIFPGIPTQTDPASVESGRSRGMRSNPNVGNSSGNISPDRSIVTGADVVKQHSNPGNEHDMSASGIDRKTDKDSHRTKQQVEQRDKASSEVKVNIDVQRTSPSDSQEEKEDAQNIMFDEVSKSKNKRRLEKKLSDDLETPVEIINVSVGSVIIHMTLEEEEALNDLVFMSDTGLLSSRMQSYLVTQDYLNLCKAEKVKIKATVKSEKMPPLLEELLLECIVENENLLVKCSFEAADDHEVTWFKDGRRLEMTERHTVCLEDNKPKMRIVKTTIKDSGRYKCEYTGLDDRIHIMECSVLIFPDPPKDVDVTDINNTSAVVKWSAPDNNLPYVYNVYYWPESDFQQEILKQDLDVTSYTIENLNPGETYRVSVTSIPHEKLKTEDSESDPEPQTSIPHKKMKTEHSESDPEPQTSIPHKKMKTEHSESDPEPQTFIPHKKMKTEHSESDPEPLNGLRWVTKPSKPTNIQVSIDGHRVEIGWQAGPGNNSGFIVRYIEIGKKGKHPPQEIECTNTSLTLDDLKPNTEYSFTVTSLWYKKESDESETVKVKTDKPR